MIGLAAGTQIWIVAGVTDMRRGFTGLSGMVQTAVKENPFSGQVFVFRRVAQPLTLNFRVPRPSVLEGRVFVLDLTKI